MKKILVVVMATSLMAITHANLLTNGGFETGTFAGWTVLGQTPPTITPDAFSGSFAASFAGFGVSSSITQTFFVQAGWTYNVKMQVKNNGVGDDRLYVQIGGSTPVNQVPIALPLESWSEVSFQWLGESTGLDGITIGGYDPNTFQLDNVSVTAVPEPGTMIAVGLGVSAVFRRKKA